MVPTQRLRAAVFLGGSRLCGDPGDNDSQKVTERPCALGLSVQPCGWELSALGLFLGEACSRLHRGRRARGAHRPILSASREHGSRMYFQPLVFLLLFLSFLSVVHLNKQEPCSGWVSPQHTLSWLRV